MQIRCRAISPPETSDAIRRTGWNDGLLARSRSVSSFALEVQLLSLAAIVASRVIRQSLPVPRASSRSRAVPRWQFGS